MISHGPLPPEVAHTLAAYQEGLRREELAPLRGLYLVGSLALGDYRSGTSDIDYVAVLDAEPSPETVAQLSRVHAALSETGRTHFDGFYVGADLLRQPAPEQARIPFVLEGELRSGETCREANPAVWACLARYGCRVLGPSTSDLRVADHPQTLQTHQIANLNGYWRNWVEQMETGVAGKTSCEDCDGAALTWGVLGVSRIACTLATGDIVSKSDGGRFAMQSYPASWRPIVEKGLALRAARAERVSIADMRQALAYMRFAIATATSQAT